MEKWKVVVIVLLIGMLGGYGFYQQIQQTNAAKMPPEPPAGHTKTAPQINLVGKPVPNWSVPADSWMNTKKPIAPADFKGSVTLLEFFRIGCSHCQEAAPMMEELYKKYSPRGMKMVALQAPGVDPAESDWANVQTTLKNWGVEYPIGFDKDSKIFKGSFGGLSYPSVYLIDKTGVIRYQHTGHTDQKVKDLVAALDKLMK